MVTLLTHMTVTGCMLCFFSEWPKFVNNQIIKWQNINSNVLRSYTGPLYILHHENLLKDLKNELVRIFEFLNIAVNATALDCAVINQEGNFHRVKKPVQWMTLYTAEMIRSVTIATGKVSDILESRFGTHLNYSMPED